MPQIRSLALMAATVTLLGGCGGDDGPTPDEQNARAAAKRFFSTHDATVVCRDLVTDDFVDEVFGGDVHACETSAIADPPAEGRQVVRGVSVAGRSAKISTVLEGGVNDRTRGTYFFKREGAGWRLKRFDTEGEDAAVIVLADQVDSHAGVGFGGSGQVRDCFAKQVVQMDWQQRQPLLRKLLTHDRGAERRVVRLIDSCR